VAGYPPRRLDERAHGHAYRQLLSDFVTDGQRAYKPSFDQMLRSGSRRQARARNRPRLPWPVQVLLGMMTTVFCFACLVMTLVILGLFR
jgi:hypothetical protein